MALSEQSTLAESSEGVLLHNWICNISVGTTVPILRGGSLTVYLSVHRRSKMIQILVQNDGMFVKTPSFCYNTVLIKMFAVSQIKQ